MARAIACITGCDFVASQIKVRLNIATDQGAVLNDREAIVDLASSTTQINAAIKTEVIAIILASEGQVVVINDVFLVGGITK